MLNYATIQQIIIFTRMFFDIFILWLLLYYAIKIVRNNSRTVQIFKGIILVLIIKGIANFFGLKTVGWIADIFVTWGFLAIIIIFQPEVRSLLEKLGKSSVFSRISTLSGNEKEVLVDELVKATMLLSKNQTGALITLEQAHSLNDYIRTGTPMNSMVTAELLTSIFVTSTPLHDGAVIIQGDKIACASAYFPPTNLELPSRYGARHRAAIGISEITDSATIVVSEETGNISIAEEGKLSQVSKKELRDYLMRIICNEETEMRSKNKSVTEKKSFFVLEEPKLIIEENPVSEIVYGSNKTEKEVKEKKTEKLMDKIAIKKQNQGDENPNAAEEVKPSLLGRFKKKEEPKDTKTEPVIETSEESVVDKKSLFGIFKKKEEDQAAVKLEELEQEEENIKLPKKKKRAAFETAEPEENSSPVVPEVKEEAAVTEVLEIKPAVKAKKTKPRKKAEPKEVLPEEEKMNEDRLDSVHLEFSADEDVEISEVPLEFENSNNEGSDEQ